MASLNKTYASLWIFCLVLCHLQEPGSALFLGKKKSVLNYLVKKKLEKLHAALSEHDHDDYDIAHYHHYHYDPLPVIVVPHHHHGVYKSVKSLGHYIEDPWHLSHSTYHGWSDHHEY